MTRNFWAPVVLFVIGLAAHAVAVPSASSLLLNGDFEEGTGTVPSHWSLSFYPHDPVGGTLTRSLEQAHAGRWSLRIDTGPVLGKDGVLCFNEDVAAGAQTLRGRRVALSGWVYVQPGSALRPLSATLRLWDRDAKGNGVYAGSAFDGHILGTPGAWKPFRLHGRVPDVPFRSMDLHCSIRPDVTPTVQFIDDLRLEEEVLPDLDLQRAGPTVWRDSGVLAVRVSLLGTAEQAARLDLRLVGPNGKVARSWPRPAKAGWIGLPLVAHWLPEGHYTLWAIAISASGETLTSAHTNLDLAASPWEDATQAVRPRSARAGVLPEGFSVLGSVAPTSLLDDVPAAPDDPAATPPPEALARGFAVFSRHWSDPPSRMGRPRPDEMGALRMVAAPGQYEPACVSAWALRDLRSLRVRAADLGGSTGAIPASNMDVRVLRSIRGLPPFLEKRPSIDLPGGQTVTFWLTVYVPPGTLPGFYRSQVELSADGTTAAHVPLLLRVLPVKLLLPQKGYGFWWKMDGRWHGYGAETPASAIDQIRKQFILLREHGCNMVSCYSIPRIAASANGHSSLDFTGEQFAHDRYTLADFIRLGRETRLFSPTVPLQYPGTEMIQDYSASALGTKRDSPDFDRSYTDLCRQIDEWARRQGVPLAFACVDEIGNAPERVTEALRYYRDAKAGGVLTSVTDNSMYGGVFLSAQPEMRDLLGMRVFNFITPEMIADTRKARQKLWLYNLGPAGSDPALDRFVFGLFTDRCGADGYAQWAFQWPEGNRSPYESAAAGKPSGYHYALPAPDGPLPTVGMEGVREGIDDARYLAALRTLDPASAAAFLKDLPTDSPSVGDFVDEHRGIDFDARRWKIARAILDALGRKAGK